MLLWSFLRTISDDIDEVPVVKAVQLGCFVQESEVPIRPYPWLAIAEIVLCFCQSGTFQVGNAVKDQ